MRYQTMLLTNPIDHAAANLLHQQQKVGPLFIIGVFLKAAQQLKLLSYTNHLFNPLGIARQL